MVALDAFEQAPGAPSAMQRLALVWVQPQLADLRAGVVGGKDA